MPLHLQVGKQRRVAVVFSCPGRHEEAAGYPAARITGRNLDTLLMLLSKALKRSDLTRSNITITNAWPLVEYKAKTGRSQATAREIKAPDNLKRLEQELAEITDFIIFCGARAGAVSQELRLKNKPKLVLIQHLGLRGLSLIAIDVSGEPIVAADIQLSSGKKIHRKIVQSANTEKRLAVLVHSIVTQLKSPLPNKDAETGCP
jgi:hypothetical protein